MKRRFIVGKLNLIPVSSNLLLGILITIGLVLFANGALAQTLWGNTVYGMSTSDVLKAVPGARMIDKGHSLRTGAKELVRAEDIQIVKVKFDARFFFLDQKLVQVTLSLRNRRSFDSTLSLFESLTDALRSKYGAELSRNVKKRGTIKEALATWISGKTNISLLAMTVGDTPATLNINYQIRISKEAEKL